MIAHRKPLITCLLLLLSIHGILPFAEGQNTSVIRSIPVMISSSQKPDQAAKPLVGFVSPLPFAQSAAEVQSAYSFLKSNEEFSIEYLTIRDLEKQGKKLGRFSVLWFHRADTLPLTNAESGEKTVQAVKTYVENGGRLLLTLQAVHYLNALGFEPQPLTDSTKTCIDDGNGRKLGFHAFREHPVFEGLNGGAYVNRPVVDIATRITGYFGERIPLNGKVVAVDWDYIFLRENSKLVFEHTPGKGKVLSVGGYMNFSMANLNRQHLELFTGNCLRYLLDRYAGQPEFTWNYSPNTVSECRERPQTDQLLVAIAPSQKWDIQSSGLTLKNPAATDNFWDVAGERIVTMGSEKGGIEEAWAHPFMAFRDYEAGIRFQNADTIVWLNGKRPEIIVNPACFSRMYKFPGASLNEVIANDPVEPNGVIHYEYSGDQPAELIIRFRSNLRWMWPYSEKATGPICYSWDPDVDAFEVQDQSGDLNVKIGGTRKPVSHLEGRFGGFEYNRATNSFKGIRTDEFLAAGLIRFQLVKVDNLDIVYTATNQGYMTTKTQYSRAIHEPKQIYSDALRHAENILAKSLMITTPDVNFNTGYRWALLATDRFFVNTPGMGKAMVAGYATTRHGWDGQHKVNGRPGYAWYFGRDGEWSSYALLDCGDFGKAKEELEFFNRYQDLSGKIFHEASTSGIIHYDAADATPLYIVLAGKYFRHTNDTAFARKTWPNVKKAIAFCYSTDTDNDHLIENTNVGHGWVEGGELYGSHATLYMTGSWAAALTEAANIAGFMKDADSVKYAWESDELKKIINTDFWSDRQKFFAYGKNRDGSFRRDPTALPAVPIYFRMTDQDKAAMCLRQYAGNAFSTNWGVRIIREDNPLFKPTGYHYGSVWPLFTGWTSLAEYSCGNYLQGFSHLMNNLNVYRNWGLGFVEEVLNGAEYKPSGVCPHQCWSETMVLQPAIEGMLGLDVRAQENKLIFSPRLPAQWDSLDVRNIRIDDRFIDFHFSRHFNSAGENKTSSVITYDFKLDSGKPLKIEFMPALPDARLITKVSLDGQTLPFTSFKIGQAVTIYSAFVLSSSARITVGVEEGISALPAVSDPKPDDNSEGLRIISSRLSGSRYQIEVEGMSGATGVIEVYSPGRPLNQAENARFLSREMDISRFAVDFEKSDKKYGVKIITINL
jgi:glycogen debranching enzyme